MNILILGSGGREHSLAWKISQSPKCTKLYLAPGNAGTSTVAENVSIDLNNFLEVSDFIKQKEIDLLIVGPEVPLVDGIRDSLESDPELKDLKIVGPGKEGARLEGSKDYAKQFMNKYGITTAGSETFTAAEYDQAIQYVEELPLPIVLKADGLAAGKGVIICESHDQAKETLEEMLLKEKFGEASRTVVIEDFLKGIEVSVFVVTDGKNYKILPEAKDYKPIGENNTGPNTGGMGSVSPVNFANASFMKKVEDTIIRPTIDGLGSGNIPYKGFIFFGLMNINGTPYNIEYNVRMGDPETQVVLPRIKTDLVDLLTATAEGTLDTINVEIDPRSAVTVVMASGGYPGSYEKGHVITGTDLPLEDSIVFHAGTRLEHEKLTTQGGRVMAITGLGDHLQQAIDNAYAKVNLVHWENVYFRKDIGQDLLALE